MRRSRNPYVLLVHPATPDIFKVKFILISINHTLCQFILGEFDKHFLLHSWSGMSFLCHLESVTKIQRTLPVTKVLSSTGLTLLHSTKSPKFIEHFNHSDHFNIPKF